MAPHGLGHPLHSAPASAWLRTLLSLPARSARLQGHSSRGNQQHEADCNSSWLVIKAVCRSLVLSRAVRTPSPTECAGKNSHVY